MDLDLSLLNSPVILSSASGENLLLGSNDLGNTDIWNVFTCSVAKDATDPNGVSNGAFTVTDLQSESYARLVNGMPGPFVDNVQYTASIYVKEGTSPDLTLAVYDADDNDYILSIDYEWIGGVLSVEDEVLGTGTVKELSDGWWRITGTAPADIVTGINQLNFIPYPTRRAFYPSSQLTTLFYGAQFETGTSAGVYVQT